MKTIDELLDELEEECYDDGDCRRNKRPAARAAVDAEIKRLLNANEALRKAQDYVYIGRDGKSVQARDLEDRLIAAQNRIAELEQSRTSREIEFNTNFAMEFKKLQQNRNRMLGRKLIVAIGDKVRV